MGKVRHRGKVGAEGQMVPFFPLFVLIWVCRESKLPNYINTWGWGMATRVRNPDVEKNVPRVLLKKEFLV